MEKVSKKVMNFTKFEEISYFYTLKNIKQDKVKILFLGEGNFSFSLAFTKIIYKLIQDKQLIPQFDIITTSFDTEQELLTKYPEFEQIQQKLNNLNKKHENLKIQLLHSIDATNIQKSLQYQQKQKLETQNFDNKFDKIFFNHPHTGQDDLRRNSSLVSHFLYSSQNCFKDKNSEIWISLLQGQFDRWLIEKVLPNYNMKLVYHEILPNIIYENGFEARRNLVGSNFQNSNIAKTFDKMSLQSYNYVFQFQESQIQNSYPHINEQVELINQFQNLQLQKKEEQIQFQFFCKYCNKGFRKEQGKKTHEREEHEKKLLPNDSNKKKNKKNKKQDKEQQQLQQEQNQNTQNQSQNDSQNLSFQEQQTEFICKLCDNRVFKSEAGYKDHLLYKHSGEKSVKKPEFAGKILEILNLEQLKQKENQNQEQQTICKICFQDYETPEELKKHQLWLTPDLKEEIIIKCEYCQRIFKEDRQLAAHLFYCKQNPENEQNQKNQEQELQQNQDEYNK